MMAPAAPRSASPSPELPVSLALIFVLFTFGGWNEVAYVAAEIKEPRRNIVRALVWGIVSVTLDGALPNGAYGLSIIRPRTVGLAVGVRFWGS